MRIGLIGYGSWGTQHAEAIEALDDAQLVAVACESERSCEKAKKEHPQISVYTEYERVLERHDIDAVDVVIPSHLHAAVARKALLAGKHVLLEKPMALSVDECDMLIETAKQSGKVLSIGHELRLSSQWGAVKRIIENGEIGVPLYALVTLFRFPYRKGSNDWRYQQPKVGSWILEEPIHFFDFVQWFLEQHGDPIAILAHGNSKGRTPGLYDNFTSIVKYPHGAYAVITQCIAGFEHHHVVEIAGTEGSIRTTWSGTMDRALNPTFHLHLQPKGADCPHEVAIQAPSGESFELREELRLVIQHFRLGKPLYPPEAARKLVKICLEAERSLRETREIALEF